MQWPFRTEDSELPSGVGELGGGERGNSKLEDLDVADWSLKPQGSE